MSDDRQLRLESFVIDERDRVVLTPTEVTARQAVGSRDINAEIARLAERLRACGGLG